MKGKMMKQSAKSDTANALAALLVAILAIVCVLCTGCSTGKVSIGADFSCLAFSVKPAVEFTGVSIGRKNVVVTNVVCGCVGSSTISPTTEQGGTK